MKFINAKIFKDGRFTDGSFEVNKGRFEKINTSGASGECAFSNDAQATDLEGSLVIPGLIDIHGHGNSGLDFSTCNLDGLKTIAGYLVKNGITAFAPTSMTMPYETLEKAFCNAKALHDMQQKASRYMSAADPTENADQGIQSLCATSRIIGINMEGPFFSYGKRGAQNPLYLKNPDFDEFKRLNDVCGGLIRFADVAPELEGAMDFISKASQLCTVSVAHTEADYETVRTAFKNGSSHMTHLFNGMNGIHHRNPGPVCAAFDTPGVYVELICDGIHIAPPVVRMIFELFKGRVILISDSLACCGMPDGTFSLGNQLITLKEKHATLPEGTLAGSASNLFDMLKNAVSFGIPLEEAVLSATINPARQAGADNELGSVEEGKKADFLVCSESLLLKSVYLDGERIK